MTRGTSSNFSLIFMSFACLIWSFTTRLGLSAFVSVGAMASEVEQKLDQKEGTREAPPVSKVQVPVSFQDSKQGIKSQDPRIEGIKIKLSEILQEMGQLLDKTHDDHAEQVVINRLRELNDLYDQLSLELEMTMDQLGLEDPQTEQAIEKQLDPGPELTTKEIDELTHR